ncbi:MAG: TonB-dependent receptor [Bacteroidota bacterium]|nr:TonB-dependent receptor [Bacteroidota bacterium]
MKINQIKLPDSYVRQLKKFYLVMKLTWLLILALCLQSTASVWSQTTRISLKMEQTTLKELFNTIENKSGYRFFYNNDEVDVTQKVTIDVSNKPIGDILTQAFKDLPYSFREVANKLILIEQSSNQTGVVGLQQQKSISGKVTDSSGAPLPGVTVVVKGTTSGTITDFNGNYSLSNVPENATLQFSFVGMKGQEILVGNKTTLNVTLEEETIGIEEVVAIGYGTQKKENLTGSVATISSEKLTVAPMASTTNALAGRLPGLITKQESGFPGRDNASLSIRGFGAPLVIVDGVESGFNNIDANEIESVSILKDAAAAIYGARAGDGVILVTTKRGKSAKPTITLNSNMTFQGPTNMPLMGSSGQMAELSREAHANQGLPESTQRFTQEEVDLFYAGTNPDYPNTNWLDVVARDWAPQQQHNLSVRGGGDKIKYYGFLGYLDQQSMFKNNGGAYQRYNLRSNIDAKILDNLSVQIDLASIWENRDFPFRVNDESIWQEYWNTEPFWSSSLPDPDKIPYAGAGGGIGIAYMSNSKLSGYKRTQSQNFKGSLALNYDFNFIKGLSAKAFVNLNQNYSFFKHFGWLADSWSYNYSNDTYTQRTTKNEPFLQHQDSKNRILTGQFSFNYNRIFGTDHEVTALALYEVIDYYNDWISASRQGYKTTAIDYLFAGGLANQTSDGRASEMGRQSYIGRVNYAYKSKYLLEATLRVDESAKFSKEVRTGVFPSVSLGWRISEEGFIKNNLPFLDNLKLRASYSQTGKDAVGNFQYLSGYQYGRGYMIGPTASAGLVETGLPNPFLTWETMTIYNGGLDFSLLKRKLYAEFDVFYRDREGIPGQRTVSLPSTFGANLPVENLNTINTRGFELLLGHEGKFRDFRWDVRANLSWSRSKWGFFDEPVYEDPDQERQNKRTGDWTDRLFGYVSEGLFTSQEEINALDYVYNETKGNVAIKPGDIRYQDTNKDGLLNWKDMVEIGKGTTPHWIGGFNLDLAYKNFDITAFFQGAIGFYQRAVLGWGGNYSELMYNERWTPDNNHADGLIPRLGGSGTNNWNSDFYNKKADYLRLKTMSLGYNLPKSILQKVNIQNLRLYVAATNLFTISEMERYSIDPEAPNGLGGFYYPQMRTVSFGLNLSL